MYKINFTMSTNTVVFQVLQPLKISKVLKNSPRTYENMTLSKQRKLVHSVLNLPGKPMNIKDQLHQMCAVSCNPGPVGECAKKSRLSLPPHIIREVLELHFIH